MKRTIFTIVIIILFGAFATFYSFDNLRTIFIGMLPQLETIYNSIDAFFLNIWKIIFESWIKIDYLTHPELPGTIIVTLCVIILITIVLMVSSVISHSRKNLKNRFEENVKNELENLESKEAPSEFTHYDVNNVVFANNKTPLISLENELLISSKSYEDKSQALLNDKKAKPLWRTIFSVLFVIVLIFSIFLRIIYHHHYSVESTFAFILENEVIVMLFDNLDKFFESLAGGIKGQAIFELLGSVWTAEQFIEYIFVLVVGILLLTIILLVCHLILRKNRKRRNLKHKLNSLMTYKEGNISNKSLSFFGYADTRDVKGDVRTIAKLSNSEAKETREKDMYKRAAYIDDISEGVFEKGVLNLGGFVIEPSPTRRPLIKEELEEDLSMNENVTLEDIVSIEDSSEEVISADRIESFVVKDEGVNYVNPNLIDVSLIAGIEKDKIEKTVVTDLDDSLMFDDDGYAYLVKEGKNFIDDEEDISDIISLDELDKTAIIDRFGESYYSLLNDLEPFHLHKLKYDEEMERIANTKEDGKTILANEEKYEELSAREFENVVTEDKKEESVIEVEETVEEKTVEDEESIVEKVEEPIEDVIQKPEAPIAPIEVAHQESEISSKRPNVVSPSSSLKPINKLLVPIRDKRIVDESTLENNLNKLRDPLEGQRKSRPHITPVKIRITREAEPKVQEVKKDDGVVKRVPLCKFRKPIKQQLHRRIDIKPLSLENKVVTDLNNIKPLVHENSAVNEPIEEKVLIKKPVEVRKPIEIKKPDISKLNKPAAPIRKPLSPKVDKPIETKKKPEGIKAPKIEKKESEIKAPKKVVKPGAPLNKPSKPKPLDVKSIDSSKFIKK